MKYLADMARSSAVETKCEFIEVALQVFRANFAMMRTEQPALEQRGYQMDLRKGLERLPLFLTDMMDAMRMSVHNEPGISSPPVRVHSRRHVHLITDESDQMLGRRIGDAAKSDPADLPPLQFDGDDHQRLSRQLSSVYALAWFLTTDNGFVYLHGSSQRLPLSPHHGLTQLLQHQPDRAVTSQTQFSLQARGAEPSLLRAGQPHAQEPARHRKMALMQNGSGRQRGLFATMSAKRRPSCRWPALAALADRTLETTGHRS